MSLSAPLAMSAFDNGALAISTPRYLAPSSSSSFVVGKSGRDSVLPLWSPPMYLSDRDDGVRFVTSESIHGSSPESALDHTCVPTSICCSRSFVRTFDFGGGAAAAAVKWPLVQARLRFGNDGFFFFRDSMKNDRCPETVDQANNQAIKLFDERGRFDDCLTPGS